jgi:hypothetical protein
MRFVRAFIIVVLLISLAANAFMYLRWRRTRTIMTVNGQAISEKDVFDYLQLKQGPAVKAEMTARALIDQEAQKQRVVPSQADIDREYDMRKELDPQFAQQVSSNPWYEGFLKDQIREELEQVRLRTKDIPVTTAEMEEEYRSNPQRYDTPNKARCNLALIRDPGSIAEVKQFLERGVTASSIATNFGGSVAFLGDNGIYTFIQPYGSHANALIFGMKKGDVRTMPVPLEEQRSGVQASFVRLVDPIVPGHKYDPNRQEDAPITERLRIAVASRRMKPLQEWMAGIWSRASFNSEDPNDRRFIQMQLFPARDEIGAR